MDDEPQEEFVVYPTGNPDYLDNLNATEQSGQQDGMNNSDTPAKKRGRPRRNPVVTVASNPESAKEVTEPALIAKKEAEIVDTSSNDATASSSKASPFVERLMSPLFTRDIKDVPIGFMDVSERPRLNKISGSDALDTPAATASSKRQYIRKKLHWKTREKLERERQKNVAESNTETDKHVNVEDQPGSSGTGIIRKKRTRKVWVATHALRQRKVIAKRRFSPSPTSQTDNDSSESSDEAKEVQNSDKAAEDSSSEVGPPKKRFRSPNLSSSSATTQNAVKRRGRPPSVHKKRAVSEEENDTVASNNDSVETKVVPSLKLRGKRGKGKMWNKRVIKKSSRSAVAKRTAVQLVGIRRKRRSQYELLVDQPSNDTVAPQSQKRTRPADSTIVSPEAPERADEPVASDEPTMSTPVLRRRKIKAEIVEVDPDTVPLTPISPPPYTLPTRVTKQQAKQEICELYDKIPDNLISMFHHHVKGFTAALTDENPVAARNY